MNPAAGFLLALSPESEYARVHSMIKNLLFCLLCLLTSLAASDCKQPLDENTLKLLRLGVSELQLQPGDSHQLGLAIFSTYAPAQEVPACATWKVEPEGKGARISDTGLLKIDAQTPAGSKFTVTADIEKGRAQRQIPVVVFTLESQPLVGLWRQQSRSECTPEKDQVPVSPINEMEFRANGWFSVTWQPFETYRDYWGSYTADKATGALTLTIENGNYVPGNFSGTGKFKLKDKKTLEMDGIFLGEKRSATPTENNPQKSKVYRYLFIRIS